MHTLALLAVLCFVDRAADVATPCDAIELRTAQYFTDDAVLHYEYLHPLRKGTRLCGLWWSGENASPALRLYSWAGRLYLSCGSRLWHSRRYFERVETYDYRSKYD